MVVFSMRCHSIKLIEVVQLNMCSITCVALCSGNLTLLETIVKADSVVVEVTADVASSIEIPRFF